MKHICIVDDDVSNLRIARHTLAKHYNTALLSSGDLLFRALNHLSTDMILLDIEMPGMDGFMVMDKLQADARTKNIPVIFLTAHEGAEMEARALKMGVVDFISKPFSPDLLLLRVKLHIEMSEYRKNLQGLVEEKAKTIETLHGVISLNIADLIGMRDGHTGVHVKRTCAYLEIFMQQMLHDNTYADPLEEEYIRTVLRAAPLHDIGKVGICDGVLCKSGALSAAEFDQMKQHTVLGGEVLRKTQSTVGQDIFLSVAHDMALYHHEKWDGSGYMQGLHGEEIPLCARIMAIIDVYDALTSKRQYKEPFGHKESVQIISGQSGRHFDPTLVRVFMACEDLLEKRLLMFKYAGNGL